MDVNRVRQGELIAGAAAVALLIIMFLPWFGIGGAAGDALQQAQDLGFAPEIDTSANAWESFDFIDIVLFITVVVAVAFAAATAMSQTVALPVAASAIATGLGILSTLLVVYRILDPPFDSSRKYGVFLGLIAAAGIAYGGWRSMQDEGTNFSGEADRVQNRGGSGGAPPPPSQPGAGS